jgi:DNA-3-methyladenine glycosylase
MFPSKILPQKFYENNPEIVARKLLGKMLIRKLNTDFLEGIIVETEAYFGYNDPASRAYHGQKKFNKPMWGTPGKIFIYNVHRYWMLNVVAHKTGQIGAVLIRAIEPTKGIKMMNVNRPVKNISYLTNGPGKLTLALKIDKSLNNIPIHSRISEISIKANNLDFEVGCSHRIGVKEDLKRKLRFFIKGNTFVSR